MHLVMRIPSPLLSPTDRPRYVNAMFGRIAGRYDLVNTVMTFGQDAWWRRLLISAVNPPRSGRALDVGAGTGKVAQTLARRMTSGTIVALDFSDPMLREGRARIGAAAVSRRVSFVAGDALELPFPDATFDCVTTAFTVRNLVDPGAGFAEMCRVVKPGGRVACLEITRIDNPLQRRAFGLYFQGLVPRLGRLISGDDAAYRYLPASVDAFLSPSELAVVMRRAGLVQVRYRMLGFGTVTLLVGARPA